MLGQNLTDDSRICSTRDFDAAQIVTNPEPFFGRELQRLHARSAGVDQRAVDIEKNEATAIFFCHVERSRLPRRSKAKAGDISH